MIAREEELVNEEFVSSPDNYNLMPGGKFGSMDRNNLSFAGRKHLPETIEKIKQAAARRLPASAESRRKMSENSFSRRNPEAQREHAKKAASGSKSKEHIERLRQAHRKKRLGKLSREQVLEIFERTDKTYRALGEEYGISKEMVAAIKKKRTYLWVHDE